MSSSEYRDTIARRFTREGTTGIGAGAPIVRYQENAADGKRALEAVAPLARAADPWRLEGFLGDAFQKLEGQYAARAALDIALHDWTGKRLGIPVYRLLGLDPGEAPLTTFSIGIDTPEITRQKVREAAEFPVLKIKVGLDNDEATLDAVRSVTGKPLRVDANEGWKDKETAIRRLEWLATKGVELVEQPMPAALLEEQAWLKAALAAAALRRRELPARDGHPEDRRGVPRRQRQGRQGRRPARGAAHDPHRARLRAQDPARLHGLELGQHDGGRAPLAARRLRRPRRPSAGLDDPWEGVRVQDGRLVLPDRPGLGLVPRKAAIARATDAAALPGRSPYADGSGTGSRRRGTLDSPTAFWRDPRHVRVGDAPRVDAHEPRVLLQEAAQVDRSGQQREAVLLDVLEEAHADLGHRRDVAQRHPARLADAPRSAPPAPPAARPRRPGPMRRAGTAARARREAGSPVPRRTPGAWPVAQHIVGLAHPRALLLRLRPARAASRSRAAPSP